MTAKVTVKDDDSVIFEPLYTTQTVAPGSSATDTPADTEFTEDRKIINKDGTTPPAGAKYKINESNWSIPSGWSVTIDETTGVVSYTIPLGAQNGEMTTVPIIVRYADGTSDMVNSTLIVGDAALREGYVIPHYGTSSDQPDIEQTMGIKGAEPVEGKKTPSSYKFGPEVTVTSETGETQEGTIEDRAGNVWTLKLNKTTGEVKAKSTADTAPGNFITVDVAAQYLADDNVSVEQQILIPAIFGVEDFFFTYNAASTPPETPVDNPVADGNVPTDAIYSLVEPIDPANPNLGYTSKPMATGSDGIEFTSYTDDKGIDWKVSIDKDTGTITATPPKNSKPFGELSVYVKAISQTTNVEKVAQAGLRVNVTDKPLTTTT